MQALGVKNLDGRQAGETIDPAWGRAAYIFNPTIAGVEDADAILLVGTNPRLEASLLNVRIRKRWRMAPLAVGLIGEPADLTYPHTYLGAGPETLSDLAAGRHSFAEVLKGAERPLVIVGAGALARPDGAAILSAAAALARDIGAVTAEWNGFAVLQNAAARVGTLDLGFVPAEGGLDLAGMIAPGALDVVFNLGADEVEIGPGAFVIYQGTHGDRGATRADVILPGAAYTEKSATYVNLEGRVQTTNRAGFPPGDAREDWAVLRALSDVVGQRLPFDSLGALRRALYTDHPHFAALDAIEPGDVVATVGQLAALSGEPAKTPFAAAIRDFYLTNPIARASRVLAECSGLARGRALEAAE
jgi:NADH-quinone oxidoreductase subunit G